MAQSPGLLKRCAKEAEKAETQRVHGETEKEDRSVIYKNFKVIPSILTLGVVLATATVWAQESAGPTASQSMKQAGEDTEGALKNAYKGAKTAFDDTKITSKVKVALHDDQTTKSSDIDVHTSAGVVTLTGRVPSDLVAHRAEQLAENTEGVRRVESELQVATARP